MLIQEPLQRISSTHSSRPIVIVLDALDECVMDHGRNNILRIILDGIRHLPNFVRFVITSRPDPELHVAFGVTGSSVERCNLDDKRSSCFDDIARSVMTELTDVFQSHDLSVEQLWSVVHQAQGFFLWTKVVCDMIKDEDVEEPDTLLQLILHPSACLTTNPLVWRVAITRSPKPEVFP